MSEEKMKLPLGQGITASENHDAKMMDHDARDSIFRLREEIHEMLQLPPEDRANIDHIEWMLDWKPVLTVRLYPKES